MWDIIFSCSNLLYPSNRKVCRNIVSFSHSILSVILIKLDVQFRLIVLCSGSYFLWDILHMLEYKFEILYFYHHLTTIYFLFSSFEQHVIKTLLFTAELSNFPTYIVYHKLKFDKPCQLEKKIQIVWFFYFRVILFTKFLFIYYDGSIIANCLLGIYMLGLLWFVQLLVPNK